MSASRPRRLRDRTALAEVEAAETFFRTQLAKPEAAAVHPLIRQSLVDLDKLRAAAKAGQEVRERIDAMLGEFVAALPKARRAEGGEGDE